MSGIKIQGAKELQKTLGELGPRAAQRVLRNVVVDMAREVRNDARGAAPVASGNLKRAIYSVRRRGKRDEVAASVGVQKGKGAKRDAFYWHFVEFGTARLAPRPFLRPAFDRLQERFQLVWGAAIGKRIEKELSRKK
jgi:HK97 gp10 family phage protein